MKKLLITCAIISRCLFASAQTIVYDSTYHTAKYSVSHTDPKSKKWIVAGEYKEDLPIIFKEDLININSMRYTVLHMDTAIYKIKKPTPFKAMDYSYNECYVQFVAGGDNLWILQVIYPNLLMQYYIGDW